MNAKTVAIDLAKDVFEVALANEQGRIIGRERLKRLDSRTSWPTRHPPSWSWRLAARAHYWGRVFTARGHEVRLLPANSVKPYRRRSKTDRADTRLSSKRRAVKALSRDSYPDTHLTLAPKAVLASDETGGWLCIEAIST